MGRIVVIVFGLPGSGKSYFAENLAKKLEAVYISSDVVRKSEFKQWDYSLASKRKVYRRMVEIGNKNLDKGRNVVFDGTFYLESIRQMVLKNLKTETTICFIQVLAPEKLIKTRTSKKRTLSDADFDVYKKIKKRFQQLKIPHLQLESSNENLEDLIKKAIEYLNTSES